MNPNIIVNRQQLRFNAHGEVRQGNEQNEVVRHHRIRKTGRQRINNAPRNQNHNLFGTPPRGNNRGHILEVRNAPNPAQRMRDDNNYFNIDQEERALNPRPQQQFNQFLRRIFDEFDIPVFRNRQFHILQPVAAQEINARIQGNSIQAGGLPPATQNILIGHGVICPISFQNMRDLINDNIPIVILRNDLTHYSIYDAEVLIAWINERANDNLRLTNPSTHGAINLADIVSINNVQPEHII